MALAVVSTEGCRFHPSLSLRLLLSFASLCQVCSAAALLNAPGVADGPVRGTPDAPFSTSAGAVSRATGPSSGLPSQVEMPRALQRVDWAHIIMAIPFLVKQGDILQNYGYGRYGAISLSPVAGIIFAFWSCVVFHGFLGTHPTHVLASDVHYYVLRDFLMNPVLIRSLGYVACAPCCDVVSACMLSLLSTFSYLLATNSIPMMEVDPFVAFCVSTACLYAASLILATFRLYRRGHETFEAREQCEARQLRVRLAADLLCLVWWTQQIFNFLFLAQRLPASFPSELAFRPWLSVLTAAFQMGVAHITLRSPNMILELNGRERIREDAPRADAAAAEPCAEPDPSSPEAADAGAAPAARALPPPVFTA